MKASNPAYPSRAITWTKTGAANHKIFQTSENSPAKIMVLVSLAFGLFLLLLVTVWIHIDFVHLGYRIAHLKQQERMLEFENRNLKLQKDTFLSHTKLQSLARKKFHLNPLTPEQVFVTNEKGQF